LSCYVTMILRLDGFRVDTKLLHLCNVPTISYSMRSNFDYLVNFVFDEHKEIFWCFFLKKIFKMFQCAILVANLYILVCVVFVL